MKKLIPLVLFLATPVAAQETMSFVVPSSGEYVCSKKAAPVVVPVGPKPTAPVTGYKVDKNWDFGTDGTVRNKTELANEFLGHIGGWNVPGINEYGCKSAAYSTASKVVDFQPVERADALNREITQSSLLMHTRPLTAAQTTVGPASKADCSSGSVSSKFTYPSGGAGLGKDVVFETRFRMTKPLSSYWVAFWIVGQTWNNGPEQDIFEAFSFPNADGGPMTPKNPNAWSSQSYGGQDEFQCWNDFYACMSRWNGGDYTNSLLTQWHTYSLEYRKDNTYTVWVDGKKYQSGTLIWKVGGVATGANTDLRVVLDCGMGHSSRWQVSSTVQPASNLPMTCEVDYVRTFTR